MFRDAEIGLLGQRQQDADRDSTISTAVATATIVLALGAAALGMFLVQRERERARQRELHIELLHVSRLNTVGQTASTLAHEVEPALDCCAQFSWGGTADAERRDGAGGTCRRCRATFPGAGGSRE